MVLFIVIIVETFVHVQHKSGVPAGLQKRTLLRGAYRILPHGRICRIPQESVVQLPGRYCFMTGGEGGTGRQSLIRIPA
jgi:hypothetical protein